MRAQPLHFGHIHLISVAKSIATNVVVMLGSANRPRSVRNPWTYTERLNNLHKMVDGIKVVPLNDYKYSDANWHADVMDIISSYEPSEYGSECKRVLVGHSKSDTQYLQWFDQHGVDYHEASMLETSRSATEIRTEMFEGDSGTIHPTVMADYEYFKREQELFASYPYKATLNFSCADALVTCDGFVLMIKRGHSPGKGLWALPGGFKNADETFEQCARRELIEETSIDLSSKQAVVRSSRLFDSPSRGNGIPRITVVTHTELYTLSQTKQGVTGLPYVKAADDASECKWVRVRDAINELPMYDDHLDIICNMLSLKPMSANAHPPILDLE